MIVAISSAGNKIRISIERLIDQVYPDVKGKLHHRIEKIERVNPDRAKLLMSIKSLGNDASHDNTLEGCDLVFA